MLQEALRNVCQACCLPAAAAQATEDDRGEKQDGEGEDDLACLIHITCYLLYFNFWYLWN